jgi:hypothetical protein
VRLERTKEGFRERVKVLLDTFLRDIGVMQEEFTKAAPYSHEGTTLAAARATIDRWRANVAAAQTKVGRLIQHAFLHVFVRALLDNCTYITLGWQACQKTCLLCITRVTDGCGLVSLHCCWLLAGSGDQVRHGHLCHPSAALQGAHLH